MEIEDHPSKQIRVWLSAQEILLLCDVPDIGSKEWTGINLLGRAGLKVKEEMLSLRRENVSVDGPQAYIQITGSGVRPTLRRCPIPESVAYTILAYNDEQIFDITARSVRNWVDKYTETLSIETEDERWEQVSARDLRRSWADSLLTEGVPPVLVKRWGGWESADVFQEMFLSRHSTTTSLTEAERSDLY